MGEAASIAIPQAGPSEPLHGLDVTTAINLYRDMGILPNLKDALERDYRGPVSAMPLVALLLRKVDARIVEILVGGGGGRERLADALRMPLPYVLGYWDGWFGHSPTSPLSDGYMLGFSQGYGLRDLYLSSPTGARRDVD